MCNECGELYTQAGYKIVQVPMTGASSQPSPVVIKTEQPAVTQEPAGSSRIAEGEIEQPAVTQEPAGSSRIAEEETKQPAVTQELAGSSRIVEEDIEPPRPTQTITEQKTFTDAYTQTEPPCVSNAHIGTSSF